MIGLDGFVSEEPTNVDWNACVRITRPASLSTEISPTVPSLLGKRITSDLPTSSTVILNAVPRTPIRAVGVRISTFCAASFAILPLAYRTVPSATFITSLEPERELGSYMNSSIIRELCGLMATLVSSTNLIPTSPLPVLTLSLNSISEPFCREDFSPDLSTEAFPFCFTTLPIPA